MVMAGEVMGILLTELSEDSFKLGKGFTNFSRKVQEITNSASLACHLLHVCLLPDLLFDPEDGSDIFLRNVGCLPSASTVLFIRRQNSS
jgi:hypothetical protein